MKTTKRDTSPVAVSAVRPFRPGRFQPWDPHTHTLTWHTHVIYCMYMCICLLYVHISLLCKYTCSTCTMTYTVHVHVTYVHVYYDRNNGMKNIDMGMANLYKYRLYFRILLSGGQCLGRGGGASTTHTLFRFREGKPTPGKSPPFPH